MTFFPFKLQAWDDRSRHVVWQQGAPGSLPPPCWKDSQHGIHLDSRGRWTGLLVKSGGKVKPSGGST